MSSTCWPGMRLTASGCPRVWCRRFDGPARRVPLHNTRRSCSIRAGGARLPAVTTPAPTHSYSFLSAEQALQAAAPRPVHSPTSGADGSARALTFTLPPLCVWGAAGNAVSAAEHGHVGRHRSSAHSGRYSGLWAPVEAYLELLSGATSSAARGGAGGRSSSGDADPDSARGSTVAPPVCVTLRLFPDLTLAQLPVLPSPAPSPPASALRAPRPRRSLAPHEQPLEAILATEEPWGSGADTHAVFKHAIEGLRELGQRLLPQVPLVLQLPTRLLVSQQFLEEVASLLTRSGWRSVAFELPPTHQLYGASVAAAGGAGAAAVDGGWCRLPLLCTPWPALCRHPVLGPPLRRLRRRDVVPFHVLFSWATTEVRLFEPFAQSIVVDVTAPSDGAAMAQAAAMGPLSFGLSAQEARRSVKTDAWASEQSSSAQPPLGDVDADSESSSASSSPSIRVFMSDVPGSRRGAAVSISDGVISAVRHHHLRSSAADSSAPRGDASHRTGRADLDKAEAALRRARLHKGAPTPTSPRHPGPCQVHDRGSADPPDLGSASLVLDTPPDHLRALIEKSIVPDHNAALTARQEMLRKVGAFMQHALAHDAAEGTAADGDEAAELEREAAALEEMLRAANAASDAATSANVEHVMQEVQRYTMAHGGGSSNTTPPAEAHSGTEISTDRGPTVFFEHYNVWQQCGGYWSCVRALQQSLRQSSLIWTLPTYNAAAVRAWTEAYTAVCAATDGSDAPLLPCRVVPVWMPLQSAMHAEVERLLREGHVFPRPPHSAADVDRMASLAMTDAFRAEACRTWLPPEVSAALDAALSRLPADYQAHERRRLLRAYRLLRTAGAQGAGRGGCELEGGGAASSSTSSATLSDNASSAGGMRVGEEEEVGGDGGSDDDVTADGDGSSRELRIRIRNAAPPFYLLTPQQVAAMETSERRTAAAACGRANESTGRESARTVMEMAADVDEVFASCVREYYAESASARLRGSSLSALYVPSPGLEAPQLCRSWRVL